MIINNNNNNNNGIGRVELDTLPLPEYARDFSATYLFSGKVLVFFKRDEDPDGVNFIHMATLRDDGSEYREIFAGSVPQKKTANGVRHMPFMDNKRVLLGDYVLECKPDLDSCQSVRLVPVDYPWGLEEDPGVMMHWSEIIISPDNEHICWTILYHEGGCAVGIGTLKLEDERYRIDNPQIISSQIQFIKDQNRPGYIIPQQVFGGEVKQFVRGGTAISQVGAHPGSVLTDAVIQDLYKASITGLTCTPGYEETAMLSPDERLALVMSTRNSPRTNCAIIGLLPRPHARLVLSGMFSTIYMYAVAGVRFYRKGNVGPVLAELNRSATEPDYMGVPLNDPEENWVYYSPMSWHPDNKRVMWPEKVRGSEECRIRIARLPDYTPGITVPVQRTPDEIPYALSSPAELTRHEPITEGKIAGKHSGFAEYYSRENNEGNRYIGDAKIVFQEYSDDGSVFYNGFEKVWQTEAGETCYEADINMTWTQSGEMKFRLVFSSGGYLNPPKLIFPESRGWAEYGGTRIEVTDMAE